MKYERFDMDMKMNMKVCVTGGAGYLGSFLVKELLLRGYFVNATLRNLGDESKVGLLKGLANADERLKLFEADIYNPHEFALAIEGCQVVFHVATPLQHHSNSTKYKNISEAFQRNENEIQNLERVKERNKFNKEEKKRVCKYEGSHLAFKEHQDDYTCYDPIRSF